MHVEAQDSCLDCYLCEGNVLVMQSVCSMERMDFLCPE